MFSYEKRECLKEQEAEKAFNDEQKSSCYIFWQHSDDALFLETTKNLNADDLKDEVDIYVVDQEFH